MDVVPQRVLSQSELSQAIAKAKEQMEPMVMAMGSASGGRLTPDEARRVVYAPLDAVVGHAAAIQALVEGDKPGAVDALSKPLHVLRDMSYGSQRTDVEWRAAVRNFMRALSVVFPRL